jgi:hypothetical protein
MIGTLNQCRDIFLVIKLVNSTSPSDNPEEEKNYELRICDGSSPMIQKRMSIILQLCHMTQIRFSEEFNQIPLFIEATLT